MRTWIFKTDEDGKPRRFLSHREAALWTVSRVGAFFSAYWSSVMIARTVYGAFQILLRMRQVLGGYVYG